MLLWYDRLTPSFVEVPNDPKRGGFKLPSRIHHPCLSVLVLSFTCTDFPGCVFVALWCENACLLGFCNGSLVELSETIMFQDDSDIYSQSLFFYSFISTSDMHSTLRPTKYILFLKTFPRNYISNFIPCSNVFYLFLSLQFILLEILKFYTFWNYI